MTQTDWRTRAGTTFTCEKQPATAKRGMVVTNHPLASAAGAEMLAAGAALLPDRRPRQPRTFPSVTPDEPRVVLVWNVDIADQHRAALDFLAARVVRVGHSSTLVSMIRLP